MVLVTPRFAPLMKTFTFYTPCLPSLRKDRTIKPWDQTPSWPHVRRAFDDYEVNAAICIPSLLMSTLVLMAEERSVLQIKRVCAALPCLKNTREPTLSKGEICSNE
jgi:hypothetical protein